MNTKKVVICESCSTVTQHIQDILELIGSNNFSIISNLNEITNHQDADLILTELQFANELRSILDTHTLKIHTILYQVAEKKVLNFWSKGFKCHDLMPVIGVNTMFIRARGKLEKIEKEDILYIEADKKYCTIITKQKKYVLRTALKNLYEQLKSDNFIRIHRSYLINKIHISSIDTNNQNISIGDKDISIGRHYHDNLFNEIAILQ